MNTSYMIIIRLLIGLLCLSWPSVTPAQTLQFPSFLVGDWKVEDKESYEHWDKLNDNLLKGFAYSKQQQNFQVMEYMELVQTGDAIAYRVQIPEQHNGETFSFKQRVEGKQWIYENPGNDFPKTVIYELLDQDTIQIYLKNEERTVSYKLIRQRR